MKYTGKGFRLPLHAFQIDCHHGEPITSSTAIILDGKNMLVVIKNFPELEDYVMECHRYSRARGNWNGSAYRRNDVKEKIFTGKIAKLVFITF